MITQNLIPQKNNAIIAPTNEYEKLEVQALSMSKIIISYYEKLKKGGLPLELVSDLTIDFAYQWWALEMDFK